jgi:IPT/TIG domain
VTVTTPLGTSATSAADQFTFTAVTAPTVTGLSPTSGPPAGGTLVTITGTGFTGATAVDFGTTAAKSFTVVNNTTINATSPAGTGVASVTVITPGGTSTTSMADQFTYAAAAPTVVSLMRFGFHMQQTTLVLTFSTALAGAPAENVNNYQLVTSTGASIPITSAVYDPASLTVTLTPSQLLNLQMVYQLTVIGTTPGGLTSATGVPLDGLGNGTPGSNYVNMFSGEILAGPAVALQTTAPKTFAAEQREYVRKEKSFAAETKKPGVELRKVAAAEKRMAARQKRIAAETEKSGARARSVNVRSNSAVKTRTAAASPQVVTVLSASAVDALSVSGDLTPPPAPSPVRLGSNHPRG